ncbi:MAG: hypothetical protein IJ545_07740 [Alphaproteobacteria bacterium]|nr:hypothetical protein [Alphaproteobacteria bacterium]
MQNKEYSSKILLKMLTVKILHHLETVRKYNHQYIPQKIKDFLLLK